jgi:ribosomal protein S18 acetylase RimI-like enzyme
VIGRPRLLPREEGVALRALRLTVAPRALVTRAGTDVVVRTPARPDHHVGNVVDLLVPPRAADVPALVTRVRRLLEPTGVARSHLRWERPVGADDPEVAAALVAAGFAPAVTLVVRVPAAAPGTASEAAAGRAAVACLPAPGRDVAAEDAAVARRWHGADVLQRYAVGDDVATWRRWDAEGAAWDRARVRELASLGRADVWLATAQGIPVATLTVLRDGAGAAHLEDLVTHPAHRRRGHAAALVRAAVAAEGAAAPATLVTAEVEPGGASAALLARLGAEPVAEVVSALLAPGAAPGPGAEGAHR